MTKDDQPQQVGTALFEAMARLSCSMPLTGHELGALAYVLRAAVDSGHQIMQTPDIVAQMTPAQHEVQTNINTVVEGLQARVDQMITYLSIAASANLAAAQDNAATAPTTSREQ